MEPAGKGQMGKSRSTTGSAIMPVCVNTSRMPASVYADRIFDGAEMKPVMCENQNGVLSLPALHWQKAFRKRASSQTMLNFVSEKSPVIWKTLEAGKS